MIYIPKRTLIKTAKTLRFTAKAIDNWPWILIAFCAVSPVSLHIKLPYGITYSDCSYIGTRGIVSLDMSASCDLIEIVDTRGAPKRWAL